MRPLKQARATNGSGRRRRREVEAGLAAYGLLRGPRRVFRRAPEGSFEERLGTRLRSALETLGPVFSSFGLYLSTRADLFPAADCLELAALREDRAPLPVEVVAARMQEALDRDLHELFSAWQGEPFETRFFVQSHRARLRDGTSVVIKVVRPEAAGEIARDWELLGLLEGIVPGRETAQPPFRHVLDEYRRALFTELDLRTEAEAMESLAADAEHFPLFKVPRVYRQLTCSDVLTVEDLAGVDLMGRPRTDDEGAGVPAASSLDAAGFAQRLCLVWLRQALLGRAFPVEPRAANMRLLPQGQVAFVGGVCVEPPATVQANLWEYLTAAAQQPDEACTPLLQEMIRDASAVDQDELRLRLRQVVPFRDGAWSRDGKSLAEHLFVHWRFAHQCGYRARFHLAAFFRGAFAVTAEAHRLAPGQDSLLLALEELRLVTNLNQLREMMTLGSLRGNVERYTAMAMHLPQRLNEVLNLAGGDDAGFRVRVAAGAGADHRSSFVAVVALLFALATVTLLCLHLGELGVLPGWGEGVATLVFLFLGALLLRVALRAGRGQT